MGLSAKGMHSRSRFAAFGLTSPPSLGLCADLREAKLELFTEKSDSISEFSCLLWGFSGLSTGKFTADLFYASVEAICGRRENIREISSSALIMLVSSWSPKLIDLAFDS